MQIVSLAGDSLQALATTASLTEELAGNAAKSVVAILIDDDSGGFFEVHSG
jgi:hypothetical protein